MVLFGTPWERSDRPQEFLSRRHMVLDGEAVADWAVTGRGGWQAA